MKLKQYLRYFVPVLIALGAVLSVGGQAHAYTQTRLMDDAVFDNVGSLNATQIADFLAARTGPFTKLASASPCLSGYNDINFHWDGTKWHYGSDADWNTAWGPAQIPASTIIAQAAQTWGINPEVLIATLQKEESLVTGTSCDSWRYNSAMGYGCPDSGGCNPRYVGFTKQVLWGAWQLKFNKERSYGNTTWDGDDVITYVGYMTQGNRKRCGSCTVNYYDGYATLDGQSIYLENGTTASLYTYTPHLGNSTPVNFQGWFGLAVLPSYSWGFAGQTSTKDLSSLPVGQKATFTVSAKNIGTATWTNSGANAIHLGSSHPQDRSSSFATSSWLSSGRPANLNEASVAPGATGTFTFVIQAPNAPGDYAEYFNLLAEGITWMNDPGLYFSIHVIPANLNGAVASNNLATTLHTDTTASITIKVQNNGNVTWYNDGKFPITLGATNPHDRSSQFASAGWLGPNRPAKLVESQVDPGGTGTYTFTIAAPHIPGSYTESFSQLAEGIQWFDQLISGTINVQGTFTAAAAGGQTVNLVGGSSTNVTLSFANTGTATWSNSGANPVRLGTANPRDRMSQFCDSSWLGCNRPAALNETSVTPGGTGTFSFILKSNPAQFGSFNESFLPLAEGQEWFGSSSTITVNVAPASYTWSLVGQAAYTDSGKTTGFDLGNLSPGQTAWLVLKAKNTGNVTWANSGNNPIRLGTEGPKDRSSHFATPAWLGANRPVTQAEASVAPGANATFEFPIMVPTGGGVFQERFNLVVEGVTWMNDIGLYYYITVNNGYSWALVSQYAYSDSSKTSGVDLSNLISGQSAYIGFTAKNTGTATWFNNGPYPVDVATTHPLDRTSIFVSNGWLNPARPARLKQTSVAPGQTGTFEFNYTAPATRGTYIEYFNPVAEGITHFNDLGMYFYTVIK